MSCIVFFQLEIEQRIVISRAGEFSVMMNIYSPPILNRASNDRKEINDVVFT